MLTIAYYFLQVVLCSAMMMGYYWLVLRNKRFHQYNRFYLLAVALLSWMVPLVKIQWNHQLISEEPQMYHFLSVVADNNSFIEKNLNSKGFQWSWNMLATGIYFAVAIVLLFGMLRAFYRIYHLLKDNSCKNVGDVYLILTQAKGTPFSFFRYIFWNEEIDIRSEAGKQILQHELTHVQQKHSFDKVLIQLILICGWFNPFFWLLRKEMDMIHEFIADKKAVNNGDTASLAQMLLTAAYPQQQFALTHPFFFSPIKRRLKMLANNKNPRFSYVRRLVVLPLLIVVVVLFAFRNKEENKQQTLSIATIMEKVAENSKTILEATKEAIVPVKKDTVIVQADTVYIQGKDKNDVVKIVPVPTKYPLPNNALMILDGKKVDNNILKTLNPNQIASVNVLKDASAVAFYGEEGKNGVVMITTKVQLEVEKKNAKEKSGPPRAGIHFTALAKDASGNPAKNRKVFVKPTIIQGGVDGKKVWEETHLTETDRDGIYTIVIGQGDKIGGISINNLSEIDWGNGPFFIDLKISIAPDVPNGVPSKSLIDMGTTQMMSIPYALFQGNANDINAMTIPNITDSSGRINWTTPQSPNSDHSIIKNNANNTTHPLILIDGVKGILNNISPDDIKSINVLKGESAIKKYGNDGKDGVIEITSKSKKENESRAEKVNESGGSYVTTEDLPVNSKLATNGNKEYDKVFTVTQIPAEFPGGLKSWEKYLLRNLDINIVNKNGGPPGKYTVVVSFVVDKSGNLSEINALNDPGYGTKEESIRIIAKGPKWKPAIQNGNPVIYRHKQSISFFVDAHSAISKPVNISSKVESIERKRTQDEEIAFRVMASRAAANNNKLFFIIDGSPCLLWDETGTNFSRIDGTSDVAILLDGKKISSKELNKKYGRKDFVASFTRNSRKYGKMVFFLSTKSISEEEVNQYVN